MKTIQKTNPFQRTMLQWNTFQPYNAAHLVHINAPFDHPKLEACASRLMTDSGLGCIRIKANGLSFEVLPIQSVPIERVESVPGIRLDALVEKELNTPFPVERIFLPFRFTVVTSSRGFDLILTYFHMIGDADSIRLWLNVLFKRYFKHADAPPPHPYPNVAAARRRIGFRHAADWMADWPSDIRRMRSAFKVGYPVKGFGPTKFLSATVDEIRFRRLSEGSRRTGVKLNDFFLSAILRALEPVWGAQLGRTKRSRLAVASIVNVRRDLGAEAGSAFGLYLGSFTVSHAVKPQESLGEILVDVTAQTRKIKLKKIYLRSDWHLEAALAFYRFANAETRKKLYTKYHPLAAALTNVDGQSGSFMPPEVEGYVRGVSTSPAYPLVFSVTTFRDRLSLGVSFNPNVYSKKDVEKVSAGFIDCISKYP